MRTEADSSNDEQLLRLTRKELNQLVQAEVQRVFSEEKGEEQRKVLEEIQLHRTFLNDQLKEMLGLAKWVIGFAVAVVGLLLANKLYFAPADLEAKIDDKMIEYRLVEKYTSTLDTRFNSYLSRDELKQAVSDKIYEAIRLGMEERIDKVVGESMEGLSKKEANEILKDVYGGELIRLRGELDEEDEDLIRDVGILRAILEAELDSDTAEDLLEKIKSRIDPTTLEPIRSSE